MAKRIDKAIVKKLAKQKRDDEDAYTKTLPVLAQLYGVTIERLEAVVDSATAKSIGAQRLERAEEFTSILNGLAETAIEIGGKRTHLFKWLRDPLAQAFKESMVPTIVRQEEQISFKVVPKAVRGRPGSILKFRPDLLTFLDGTPILRTATQILRSEQYKNSKAGRDQAMVDNGTAKGARSAPILGLSTDACDDMPIFRAWHVLRDEEGIPSIDKNGMPVAKEVDVNAGQYIDNLADNKGKFRKMAEVREKYPQPKEWPAKILNKLRKEAGWEPTATHQEEEKVEDIFSAIAKKVRDELDKRAM